MPRIAKSDVHAALQRAAQHIQEAAGKDGRVSRSDIATRLEQLEGTERKLVDIFYRFIDKRDHVSGAQVTKKDVDRAVEYAKQKLIDKYDLNDNGLSKGEIARMSLTGQLSVELARELKAAARRPLARGPGAAVVGKLTRMVNSHKLGYPPAARRYWADELEIDVSKATGGHTAAMAEARRKLIERFSDGEDLPADPFAPGALREVDMEASFQPDVGIDFLRSYLGEAASEEHADEVKAILEDGFDGQIGFAQMYDIGAEVIGDDFLILTPRGSDESTVIHFDYVDA